MTITHDMLNWFQVRPLMLASALALFSPCGFAEDIDVGKMNYESNCAACHGTNGKGDGPLSAELRTKPSDLTLIGKRNGGVFPADVLYRIIDGRKTIRAHGTYEMPVWGFVFRRSDPEDVARNRILAIIAHLKSIQVE
jgi:mono/diheme cytochrome c family protein